jgi:hypothetical protein
VNKGKRQPFTSIKCDRAKKRKEQGTGQAESRTGQASSIQRARPFPGNTEIQVAWPGVIFDRTVSARIMDILDSLHLRYSTG